MHLRKSDSKAESATSIYIHFLLT